MRVPPATQAAHVHPVVSGKAQQRLARELGMANEFGLGQTRPLSWPSQRPPRCACAPSDGSCSPRAVGCGRPPLKIVVADRSR
jgi:hypothetical protein